jgi:hypothetical protein
MTQMHRATVLACAASAVLLVVALRHHLVWGAGRPVLGIELHVLLGIGEGLGLVLFTILGARALHTVLHGPRALTTVALLRAGAVVALAAALVPPVLSSDVFDYIARGRVEAHYGANPYLVPPAQVLAGAGSADAVLRLAEWPAFVMPYGPISALLQALCAGAAGAVPWLGVYFYKLLCAAAHVATGWLLGRAAPPAQAQIIMALWLFHPWLLLESCGSAHNEVFAALALAWMLERLARDRWAAATFAFGLAVLTKHGCAPLGPVLLALSIRQRRVAPFLLGVLVTLALTALFAWRYFAAPGALEFMSKQTGNRGASLQYFASLVLGPASARPLLLFGYAAALGALAWVCARTRTLPSFASGGSKLLVLFILVAMPLFSTWYHLWWAPLVAVLPLTHPTQHALRALAWLGPLGYAVYAFTRNLDLPHQVWVWAVACALPAMMVLRRRPAARDAFVA